jgi:hypothetical protein
MLGHKQAITKHDLHVRCCFYFVKYPSQSLPSACKGSQDTVTVQWSDYSWISKDKSKVFLLQAWAGPRGSGRLRLRIFSAFGTMKVVRSSPLRTGRLYPQEFSWYSFLEAEPTPGHMVPLVATEKFPSSTTGDPETFRLVAQCLDRYATPGPIPKDTWCNSRWETSNLFRMCPKLFWGFIQPPTRLSTRFFRPEVKLTGVWSWLLTSV